MLTTCQASAVRLAGWLNLDAVSGLEGDPQTEWHQRLDWLLDRRGHGSGKELAELLAVDDTQVSHYRAGRRFPDLRQVQIICRTFNVSADWLLGLDQAKAPPGLTDRQVVALGDHLRRAQDLVRDAALAARGRAIAAEAKSKTLPGPGRARGRR